MDAVDALALLEALLIIAALLAHTAIKVISPSLHASNHVILDSSNSDSILISRAPSLDDFSNTKYDVFLSFRGEDTRDNFTSHLYEALCREKIQAFIDDKIQKGEGVSPILRRKIENSDIYVIVFSKYYASSTWCLDELTNILECKNKYQREVIPIFYNVDPSHVRKQSGSYGDAFIKHNHRFTKNRVRKWKHALTQAATLSGWDSNNIRPESKLVNEIVKVVLSKLKGMSPSHFEGLFGISDRVKEIETILLDFHIVGIWGMGGIGKTTLAEVVFHELKEQFDSYSFVNVRGEPDIIRLGQLQKKCLEELLEDDDIDTYSIGSNLVKKRLQRKKILLILDDVNDYERVKNLVKLHDWSGQGSRLIIISRDKQVLTNIGAYKPYKPYHVQGMDYHDALLLFSLKAFNQNEPPKNYLELSKLVVSYCQGIPLALIVLGCFLHGRIKEEWQSALDGLKQAPHKDIFNVLKLSFDALSDKQKNLFLDIACFFRGRVTLCETDIQSNFDFSTKIELSVLEDRSLISFKFGRIVMHDLVAAMGLEVASQQFTDEPQKPIRLWRGEHIYRVLTHNVEIEKIRGISLDMCETKNIHLKDDVFRKMYNLRFLIFYKSYPNLPSKVNILEGFNFLPEELRILFWENYSLPNVPLSFCADNLVRLEMVNSNLQKLWDGDQHFPNLKVIDLFGSKLLTELPDLSQAPNITKIQLSGCVNLLQINSSTSLVKLRYLCLDECKKIRSAEILTFCNELSHLYWEQCPLKSLPLSCLRNLVWLKMPESKLEQLWDGKQHFPTLELIDVRGCKNLIELPDLSQTPNIKTIVIDDCVNLLQVHSSSSLLKLRRFYFNGCNKLRRVNLAGNVHSRRSGALEIACNYFDLRKLTFNKVCIRFFLSDDGNIYAFGFKAAAVAFTKMWDCMHVRESGELKLLAQTLSSSLPFVRKLIWFDRTSSIEFESSPNQYMLETSTNIFEEGVNVQLKKRLEIEGVGMELEQEFVREEERMRRTTTEGIGMELEEELIKDECCRSNMLTRSPNSITHWSLLTNLSLQKTNIVNVQWSIPGVSFLKALAKYDCSKLQPILDLTFPVNAEISELSITFSEYLNRRYLNRAWIQTVPASLSFQLLNHLVRA